jgi:hypothetical protein
VFNERNSVRAISRLDMPFSNCSTSSSRSVNATSLRTRRYGVVRDLADALDLLTDDARIDASVDDRTRFVEERTRVGYRTELPTDRGERGQHLREHERRRHPSHVNP